MEGESQKSEDIEQENCKRPSLDYNKETSYTKPRLSLESK